MALLSSKEEDSPGYAKYCDLVRKERELLDIKDSFEQHLKWLDQTLTLCALNASSPSDPSIVSVTKAIKEHKAMLDAIVSSHTPNKIKYILPQS